MPYSEKQRSEDLFLLAAITHNLTTAAVYSTVVHVPIRCTIDHIYMVNATAGATSDTTVWAWTQPLASAAPSDGTMILGSSATATTVTGGTLDKANFIDNLTFTSANGYVTAPSSGVATAYWTFNAGESIAVQILRGNNAIRGPATVQVWAYRRAD